MYGYSKDEKVCYKFVRRWFLLPFPCLCSLLGVSLDSSFYFFCLLCLLLSYVWKRNCKKAESQNTSSKLTSSNQKECCDVVVDSIIRKPIFDCNGNEINHTHARKSTASTCNSVPDFSKHTCCFVRISSQCLWATLSVVDGVVFKCPADTWFSPTCTLHADDYAGAQVTDMFLDKT